MNNENNNYKTERINDLEDQRFERLCSQVEKIHEMLVVNGLIKTVASNKARIKIVLWITSVLLALRIGVYFI